MKNATLLLSRLRDWARVVSGVTAFVVFGAGIPLAVLDQLRVLMTVSPGAGLG